METTRVTEIVKLNTKIEKLKAKLKAEEAVMSGYIDEITVEWKANLVAELVEGVEIKSYEKTKSIAWKAEFVKRLGEAVAKRLVKRVGTDTWLSIFVNGINFQKKLK